MNTESIIIIANDPEASEDLSAIIPVLGERKTGFLGRAMFFDTLALCLSMPRTDTFVYYHPVSSMERFKKMISLFSREEKDRSIKSKVNDIRLYPQNAGTMIMNISNAFEDIFKIGYKRVIMIGAYCMPLNMKLLKAGFLLLKKNDVVIGPSFSGRYYLFGMAKCMPEVFNGVHWESNDFYINLASNLKAARTRVQELELSYEVYTTDELNQLIADIDCWRSVGDERTAFHTERFLRTLG